MQRVSAVPVLTAIAAISLLLFLPACGGGTPTSSVSQIVITPSVSSLNQGAIATLTATPEDSSGTAVAADLTFSSSSSTIGAVSPGGEVCGGSWDPSFVYCTPVQGAGGVGQVTITATATASGIKATATVYVHEVVNQVNVFVQTPCTSMGQQVKLYAQVLNTTAPGCSSTAPCDITSTVGPIAFGTNNSGVVSVTTAGQLMAGTPGVTTVFASVSGVNSVGTPYMTCPVATILVHDASSSNTSFTIGTGGSQALTADVYDTNNQYIKPTLTWGSSSTAVATVAATGTVANPGTITGVAPGTAYVTATCSYPNCNLFLPPQYSQNLVTTSVVGGTSTTVYAASTKSTMLVPFPINTDVPGTAITLPYTPNSIIADPAGAKIYLGSTTALMVYTISTGAVTTLSVPGIIQAISPDGNFLLLSDTVGGNLNYYDLATSTITSTQSGLTVTSDAYTPDSDFNEWVTGMTYGFGSPAATSGTVTLPNNNTGNALDIMAQGGLTYISSAAAGQIYIYWTCNQLLNQTLTATSPTLIKALPNGTGAAAADSPNLDLISTPSTLAAGCPTKPGESPSTLTPYDLGAGAFTATQIFMSPDSSRVWIMSNLPQILNFNLTELVPNNVFLGSAVPLYGGMTLDSAHAYIGTSDGTVHRIDTKTMTDVAQIAVGLKDSSGNVTPPNLVSVLP